MLALGAGEPTWGVGSRKCSGHGTGSPGSGSPFLASLGGSLLFDHETENFVEKFWETKKRRRYLSLEM